MAYSPKQKASALKDVIDGMSLREVAQKHKVPIATLSRWLTGKKIESKRNSVPKNGEENGTKTEQFEIRKATPEQLRRAEFDRKLINLLGSSLDMLEAWAKQCQDPDFIRKDPEGVNELGRTVLERCDRIVELVRNNAGTKPK